MALIEGGRKGNIYFYFFTWPPRRKRDGGIEHISERENGNWMKMIALLRDKSIWHPACLVKTGLVIAEHYNIPWLIYLLFTGVKCVGDRSGAL